MSEFSGGTMFTGVRVRLLVHGLVLICVQSCTLAQPGLKQITIGDGGFLSQNPCGPPCFWGITPGITNEFEAVEILRDIGIWEKCEIYDTETESGTRGITCARTLTVVFERGGTTVEGVGFQPSLEITVADVLDHFGEPDYVLVTAIGIPEHPRTTMSLYYERIATRLNLPEQEGIVYIVSPSTRVEHIAYFSASQYKILKDTLPYLPAWNGYGKYERYVR